MLSVLLVCSFAFISHRVDVAPSTRQTQTTKKCLSREQSSGHSFHAPTAVKNKRPSKRLHSNFNSDDGRSNQNENIDDVNCGRVGDDAPAAFTQAQINEMENLIESLSREADDNTRRKRLADMLDEELAADASNAESFTKLFQLSLDNIGERVQANARELALEKQQQEELNLADIYNADNVGNPIEADVVVRREKSEEELQLWALIDMMVQSKTHIKGSIRNN